MKKIWLAIIMSVMLVGCSDTEGINIETNALVEGKEDFSTSSSCYISDENYEPSEEDFLALVMNALVDTDTGNYDDIGCYFAAEADDDNSMPVTGLIDAYEANKAKPIDVSKITYNITNKSFESYNDDTDEPMEPYDVDVSSEGIQWKDFQYDSFMEFEFELTRTITKKDGTSIKDDFLISGTIPPLYTSFDEARWYIGDLEIAKAE